MPQTVQLNTRIAPELKRRGDVVFARAGLSPSEVVRAVWESAARTQELPACVKEVLAPGSGPSRLDLIEKAAGFALAKAAELGLDLSSEPLDYDALVDGMYDDMLVAMEEHHA